MEVETLFTQAELQRIQTLRYEIVRDHLERFGAITHHGYEMAMANAIEAFENERDV